MNEKLHEMEQMSIMSEEYPQAGINGLACEIHENARAHGWWVEKRALPEILMLCVSELSEALEEYRDGKLIGELYYEGEKPCGIAVEFADCVIRIFDYLSCVGVDIEKVIRLKHEYNKTRPFRHGGKIV